MSSTGINPKKPGALELLMISIRSEIANVMPSGKALEMGGGVTNTVDEVAKELDDYVSAFKAVRDARLAWLALLAKRRELSPEAKAFVERLHAALVSIFGSTGAELVKLGFPEPKTRQPLTAEENVLAAAKRAATRAKLHTLGPRQKEALLKAEGGSVVVVPHGTTAAANGAAAPGA